MRRIFTGLAVLLLLGAAGAAAGYLWLQHWLSQPIATLQAPMIFETPRGASLSRVAQLLTERGVLEHPQPWIVWARLTGRESGLRAGEYQLTPGLSPRGLLDLLSSGEVLLHSITFVEGSTFAEMRRLLAEHEAIDPQSAAHNAAQIMAAIGSPDVHPEGQFFPDTYRFARRATDLEILALAHERMKDELERAWAERSADLPLANAYQSLILASIVEKETALDRERRLIAGVFIERLRRGMRLQTDPTVIYGMQQRYDGNIRRVDLLRDTPYNTYTRPGLPPTPIAMPGLESLRAAVQPDVTGALFFVATGEGDGSHYFSKTLAEHNAAVKRYLQKLRGS